MHFSLFFLTLTGYSQIHPGNLPSGPISESRSPKIHSTQSGSQMQDRVSGRKGNLKGQVPVFMYHKFSPYEKPYTRSYEHFRQDLTRLYRMGFRPITVSEYLDNHLHIPSGSSPVILTFDDSNPTQIVLNKAGSVTPDCAVGIWENFSKSHPDFPVKATWFVLPRVMWGQPEWTSKKIEILKSTGSELASHTWSHPSLRRLSDLQVKREVSRSLDFLAKKGFRNVPFAYPYGIFPRHWRMLKGFWLGHQPYYVTGAVTCDPQLAEPPGSGKVKRYEIPRIGGALEGWLGINYWLDRIQHGKNAVYVVP